MRPSRMTRTAHRFVFLVLALACCAILAPAAFGANEIVVYRPGIDVSAKAHQEGITPEFLYTHAADGFAANLTTAQSTALAKDPDVLMVEPNRRFRLSDAAGPGWSGLGQLAGSARRLAFISGSRSSRPGCGASGPTATSTGVTGA